MLHVLNCRPGTPLLQDQTRSLRLGLEVRVFANSAGR